MRRFGLKTGIDLCKGQDIRAIDFFDSFMFPATILVTSVVTMFNLFSTAFVMRYLGVPTLVYKRALASFWPASQVGL